MAITIKRRNDLTVRDLGSEMIIYDGQAETFHILNRSARSIWLLLDEGSDSVELQDKYAGLYPKESRARLEKDLLHMLDELSRKGLLVDH